MGEAMEGLDQGGMQGSLAGLPREGEPDPPAPSLTAVSDAAREDFCPTCLLLGKKIVNKLLDSMGGS